MDDFAQCPHCGMTWRPEPHWHDADGDEVDCDECGKQYYLTAYGDMQFETCPVDNKEQRSAVDDFAQCPFCDEAWTPGTEYHDAEDDEIICEKCEKPYLLTAYGYFQFETSEGCEDE